MKVKYRAYLETTLDTGSRLGFLQIFGYVLSHGRYVSKTDNNGKTPLYLASQKRHPLIVEFFIEH